MSENSQKSIGAYMISPLVSMIGVGAGGRYTGCNTTVNWAFVGNGAPAVDAG